MPEEPTPATAAEGQATAQAAAQPTEAAAPQVDYNALLDQIPDDVIRSHRRINGYAGSMAQRMAEAERQRIAQEEYQRAQAAREAELMREAEENPFAFSQKWLKGKAEERAKLELSELRTKTQTQLFEKIASSYAALPEWQQLTPDEFARVSQAVAGKSDDDLVAAFNVAALDVISSRRAQSQGERIARERLKDEVEAQVQQRLAERLRGERPPDLMAPVNVAGISDASAIRQMSDAEFDAFYNSRFRT